MLSIIIIHCTDVADTAASCHGVVLGLNTVAGAHGLTRVGLVVATTIVPRLPEAWRRLRAALKGRCGRRRGG